MKSKGFDFISFTTVWMLQQQLLSILFDMAQGHVKEVNMTERCMSTKHFGHLPLVCVW